MGFEIEVAEILAKARTQTRTPPTVPKVPTAGAPKGQTVGTIGTVGPGRASDSTDAATSADGLRDAFEERAAIIHEAHTIFRATDATLLPEPVFTLTHAEAEHMARAGVAPERSDNPHRSTG